MSFSSLLDVGCGDGALLTELSRSAPGVKLYGLDVSHEGAKTARQSGAHTFVWDIEQAAPPLQVDVVVCSEVLEHIENDRVALANMARVAHTVVITVPGGDLTRDARLAGHLRHYTRQRLEELITDCGLGVSHTRAWGYPFYDLYKRLIADRSRGYKTSSYGPIKRLVCAVIYWIFMLNVFDKGDRLVAVASRKEEAACQ